MAIHRFKMLVDQITDQVVWLSYYIDNQPPNFESNLSYNVFNGETKLSVWHLYCTYQLFYDNGKRILYKKAKTTNPTEFKQLQFMRAKALAINYVNSAVDFQFEKYNYSNHQFYNNLKSIDQWVDVFQHVHNCSADSAQKLLKFKQEEYETSVFQLESLRYTFNNKIQTAETIELVEQYYQDATAQLINSNRIQLSKLPMVLGFSPESDTNQA
jgi:hypothetical protein